MNTCYYCCEPHKQFVQNFGNAPLQINTIRNQIAQKKKEKEKFTIEQSGTLRTKHFES